MSRGYSLSFCGLVFERTNSWAFVQTGTKASYASQRQFLQSLRLKKRCLTGIGDVGDVDTSVTILGHKYATPVMIAPTAFHGAVHHSKEIGQRPCLFRPCLPYDSTPDSVSDACFRHVHGCCERWGLLRGEWVLVQCAAWRGLCVRRSRMHGDVIFGRAQIQATARTVNPDVHNWLHVYISDSSRIVVLTLFVAWLSFTTILFRCSLTQLCWFISRV